MALDLVPAGEGQSVVDGDDDVGLTEVQLRGLEWLEDNGHQPAPFSEAHGKYIWDKNPQVRAYQMMFAGKFGGRQQGAGRPRAAQSLGEHIRNITPKLKSALDRALDEKAGPKLNLEAVKLATDIEFKEGKLRLDEDKQDLDEMGKEELLGTFFALLADTNTAGQIERAWDGSEDIQVEATEVQAPTPIGKDRDTSQQGEGDLPGVTNGRRHPRRASAARRQRRHAAGDGREPASGTGTSSSNPYTQAAKRRAANG